MYPKSLSHSRTLEGQKDMRLRRIRTSNLRVMSPTSHLLLHQALCNALGVDYIVQCLVVKPAVETLLPLAKNPNVSRNEVQ
jgi:hypothetical protein